MRCKNLRSILKATFQTSTKHSQAFYYNKAMIYVLFRYVTSTIGVIWLSQQCFVFFIYISVPHITTIFSSIFYLLNCSKLSISGQFLRSRSQTLDAQFLGSRLLGPQFRLCHKSGVKKEGFALVGKCMFKVNDRTSH